MASRQRAGDGMSAHIGGVPRGATANPRYHGVRAGIFLRQGQNNLAPRIREHLYRSRLGSPNAVRIVELGSAIARWGGCLCVPDTRERRYPYENAQKNRRAIRRRFWPNRSRPGLKPKILFRGAGTVVQRRGQRLPPYG